MATKVTNRRKRTTGKKTRGTGTALAGLTEVVGTAISRLSKTKLGDTLAGSLGIKSKRRPRASKARTTRAVSRGKTAKASRPAGRAK